MGDQARRGPRPAEQCRDAFDLLDEIRGRPGMWLPADRPLRSLEIMLTGYGIALQVHHLDGRFPFHPRGDFSRWLADHKGWSPSAGWAHAIETHTSDEDPVGQFLELLDEYRTTDQLHDA